MQHRVCHGTEKGKKKQADLLSGVHILAPGCTPASDLGCRQSMPFVVSAGASTYYEVSISADSAMARIIGMTSRYISLFQPAHYVESPPALQGPTQVYIESTFVANRACLDILENGLSIPLCSCANRYSFTVTAAITETVVKVQHVEANESATRINRFHGRPLRRH